MIRTHTTQATADRVLWLGIGFILSSSHHTPSATGDQNSAHITGETSDGADAGGRAQAEGDGEAGGASGGNGKKREREAGRGQTGRDNETRSGTNDTTAKTVAQAPESSTPTATPAKVTNKRHKTPLRAHPA